MDLVEVEGVDALLGAHQDVLVVRLGVDPRRRAVQLQRAPVEDLNEMFVQLNATALTLKCTLCSP